MTDDIVARLRHISEFREDACGSDFTEAADELERLRADLDAYQKERDEEVVRLRAELAAEKDRGNNWRAACQAQNERVERVTAERDKLRDLLREVYDDPYAMGWGDLADRIDAALKASQDESS